MDSLREQILQAVNAALNGAGKPANVLRSPLEALEGAEMPAIVIIGPGNENALLADADSYEETLRLQIGCIYRGIPPDGQTVDQLVDPLFTWVFGQMMSDPTFGGLAKTAAYTGSEWDLEPGWDNELCGVRMDFDVTYMHGRADCTQSA